MIWAKQLASRLRLCMQRIVDVLGGDWDKHVEGHKLKVSGESVTALAVAIQVGRCSSSTFTR